jgi:hypothetical protein
VRRRRLRRRPCNLITFVLATRTSLKVVALARSTTGPPAKSQAASPSREPALGAWVGKHVIDDRTWSWLVADGGRFSNRNPSTEPDGFGGVNSLLAGVPPAARLRPASERTRRLSGGTRPGTSVQQRRGIGARDGVPWSNTSGRGKVANEYR